VFTVLHLNSRTLAWISKWWNRSTDHHVTSAARTWTSSCSSSSDNHGRSVGVDFITMKNKNADQWRYRVVDTDDKQVIYCGAGSPAAVRRRITRCIAPFSTRIETDTASISHLRHWQYGLSFSSLPSPLTIFVNISVTNIAFERMTTNPLHSLYTVLLTLQRAH